MPMMRGHWPKSAILYVGLSSLLLGQLTLSASAKPKATETAPAPAPALSQNFTALPGWDSKIIPQINTLYFVCKQGNCTPNTMVSMHVHLACKKGTPEQLKTAWTTQMANLSKNRKPAPTIGDYQATTSGTILRGTGEFYQPQSEGKIASSRDYWTQGFVSSPFMSITLNSQSQSQQGATQGFNDVAQMASNMLQNIASIGDISSANDCMLGKFSGWVRTPSGTYSDAIFMSCDQKSCGKGSLFAYQLIPIKPDMSNETLINNAAVYYKMLASQRSSPISAMLDEGLSEIEQNKANLKSTSQDGAEVSIIPLTAKNKFNAELAVARAGNFAFLLLSIAETNNNADRNLNTVMKQLTATLSAMKKATSP